MSLKHPYRVGKRSIHTTFRKAATQKSSTSCFRVPCALHKGFINPSIYGQKPEHFLYTPSGGKALKNARLFFQTESFSGAATRDGRDYSNGCGWSLRSQR